MGFLHGLLDPNLAYIFFWLGLALIVLELLVPGHIFSGTVGTILLVLAFVSFGLLPVRLIGILLLVGAAVFLIVEASQPGLGIWGILGLIFLVLGGWFLYDRSTGTGVSPWVIAPVAVLVGLFFGLVVVKARKLRDMPAPPGPEAIVGQEGIAVGAGLDPKGVVRINAEQWQAVSTGGRIPAGSRVRAVAIDGLAHHGRARPEPGRRRGRQRRARRPSMKGEATRWCPLIVLGLVVVFIVVVLVSAIKVVREYQRLVVFRLGRVIGVKGPGLVLLIPFVDKATWVDLREFYLEIPHQTAITEDNASISIDFIVFNKVLDPKQSVVSVGNFAGAAQNIAATTLRSVVGDMSLDDVLAKREQMNEVLRAKLDEVTERWGVKVTNVEIREIVPPPTVQEAMTRQMSAERTRRAVVTEAEGAKQAAITVSEGNKEAAILNAEGEKQAAILRAEGQRQAAILKAEGFSLALSKINEARRPGGRQHDAPAVPRCAEGARRLTLVEGRGPDGAGGAGRRLHRARRGRARIRRTAPRARRAPTMPACCIASSKSWRRAHRLHRRVHVDPALLQELQDPTDRT